MLQVGRRSFLDRIVGVFRLDRDTFRDIAGDPGALPQALIVVALAVAASAIGTLGSAGGTDELVGAVIGALVGWLGFGLVAYFVGVTLFANPRSVSVVEVLTLVGFAQAPKLIGALGVVPTVGWIIGVLAWIWVVAAGIVALREAFKIDAARAVVTGLVSGLVIAGILAILSVSVGLGPGVLGGGSNGLLLLGGVV